MIKKSNYNGLSKSKNKLRSAIYYR